MVAVLPFVAGGPESMASLSSISEHLPSGSTCHACIHLLVHYIEAANEMVEIDRRLPANPAQCGLASALLDRARARQVEARERVFQHQQQHCSQCRCPNRLGVFVSCGPLPRQKSR